jgi:hypothetical protein
VMRRERRACCWVTLVDRPILRETRLEHRARFVASRDRGTLRHA